MMSSEVRGEGMGPGEAHAGWCSHKRGCNIYHAGNAGPAWRVVSGSVRLDCGDQERGAFGGIAVPGDVIGAETLLFGRYSLSARALASCVLEPWPGSRSSVPGGTLLRMLMRVERRTAEALALRRGKPLERIQRLMRLLAQPSRGCEGCWIALPRSIDIADVTSLTQETVSRAMAELKRRGVIQEQSHGVARLSVADAPATCSS